MFLGIYAKLVSGKIDLGHQVSRSFWFFRVFSGFSGHMTTRNLNAKVLMQMSTACGRDGERTQSGSVMANLRELMRLIRT